MSKYPVPEATETEKVLFDTGLAAAKPPHEVWYTVPVRGSQSYDEPTDLRPFDLQNPAAWDTFGDNWLAPSVQGEWFVHVLKQCQRVLDIGSGPGRPSLYLSQFIREVVGVEPGLREIEHARSVQEKLNLKNVQYLQDCALSLSFPDGAFDGVSYCYSLEFTGDIRRSLREAYRLLQVDGSIAIALAPSRSRERAEIAITADGKSEALFGYTKVSSTPFTERRYRVTFKADSDAARQIREIIDNEESDKAAGCKAIHESLSSHVDDIQAIDYFLAYGASPEQLRAMLLDAGFCQVAFWQLPSARLFATVLKEEGVLEHLRDDHHRSYLRALVRSSRTLDARSDYVSARKKPR